MSQLYMSRAARDDFNHVVGWREYLENLSDELERPIRVIGGNARQRDHTRTDWSTQSVGAIDGLTLEEANERGITVDMWGHLSHRDGWTNVTDPVEAYDVIQVHEPAHERIEYEGHLIGEFSEQMVAYYIPIHAFTSAVQRGIREFDLDTLFGEAIRSCIDADFLASRDARLAERSRTTFVQLATTRDSAVTQELRATITNNLALVANHEGALEAANRSLEDATTQLEIIESRRESPDPDVVLREWEVIQEHALVQEARFIGQSLHVLTDDITMTDPRDGRECVVGRYDLTFDFVTNTMRVHNLTNRRNGWDHPHVERGNMCHGELRNTVRQLFRRREVGAIVNLTIDMLQHVTPEDAWGRNVQWWYDAEDAPPPETQDPAQVDQ